MTNCQSTTSISQAFRNGFGRGARAKPHPVLARTLNRPRRSRSHEVAHPASHPLLLRPARARKLQRCPPPAAKRRIPEPPILLLTTRRQPPSANTAISTATPSITRDSRSALRIVDRKPLRPGRPPSPAPLPSAAPAPLALLPDYVKSNNAFDFIGPSRFVELDPQTWRLAVDATAGLTDTWQAALALMRFVHGHLAARARFHPCSHPPRRSPGPTPGRLPGFHPCHARPLSVLENARPLRQRLPCRRKSPRHPCLGRSVGPHPRLARLGPDPRPANR